jgi:hypothetical protein
MLRRAFDEQESSCSHLHGPWQTHAVFSKHVDHCAHAFKDEPEPRFCARIRSYIMWPFALDVDRNEGSQCRFSGTQFVWVRDKL